MSKEKKNQLEEKVKFKQSSKYLTFSITAIVIISILFPYIGPIAGVIGLVIFSLIAINAARQIYQYYQYGRENIEKPLSSMETQKVIMLIWDGLKLDVIYNTLLDSAEKIEKVLEKSQSILTENHLKDIESVAKTLKKSCIPYLKEKMNPEIVKNIAEKLEEKSDSLTKLLNEEISDQEKLLKLKEFVENIRIYITNDSDRILKIMQENESKLMQLINEFKAHKNKNINNRGKYIEDLFKKSKEELQKYSKLKMPQNQPLPYNNIQAQQNGKGERSK